MELLYKCRIASCLTRLTTPGLCPEHIDKQHQNLQEVKREYDFTRRDPEMRKFYATKAWKVSRDKYIFEHDVCEQCKLKAAQLVHHKKAAKNLTFAERLDPTNFESLCWSCHSRLEALRRRTGNPDAERDIYKPIDWDALRNEGA